MSRPYIVVSAVHELPEDPDFENVWEEKLRPHLDDFDFNEITAKYGDSQDGYRLSEGIWNEFKVMTNYHSTTSGNGDHVVEIEIQKGIEDIGVKGLEDILQEINEEFPIEFTLEVYYWYTGVDRTGAEKLKKEKEFGKE